MAAPTPRSTPDGELPFWEQLPQILLYPLHGAVLLSIAALSLFSALAALPGLVGLILLGVTWLAVYGYGFDILRRSANGQPRPPEHASELFDSSALRLLGLMVLCLAVVVCTAMISPLLALLTVLTLFCLHPVWLISLALDGSLRQALNPATAVFTLQRIAGPYAIALVMVFALQAAAGLLWLLAHAGLPGVLAWPVATAGYAYALFASFRLLGVMVYCYREVLGFEADNAPEQATRLPDPAERADQALLARVERLLQENRRDTARQLLLQAAHSAPAGNAVHQQLQQLLADAAPAARQAHLGQWLTQLLAQQQARQALALWRNELARDRSFAPEPATTGHPLVQAALLQGQRQLAYDGLRALLKRWPQSAQVPEWALQAALLAADLHGDAATARALIAQGQAAMPPADLQRRLQAVLASLPATL